MSTRRSTRLAGKANSASAYQSSAGNEVIYEETSAQQVNLQARTPRTPHYRSSQKRKRGPSGTAAGDGNADAETKKLTIVDIPQKNIIPQASSSKRVSLNGSSAFSPMNLENDSFLDALDKIESNGNNANNILPEAGNNDADSQCETVCDNNSPDVFGDDDDILDALPPTPEKQPVHTPRRSPKRSIPPKRLTESVNAQVKPMQVENRNDFQSAKKFLEREKALEEVGNEPNPKRGRKRSSTAGEKKKKNVGAQGKGKGGKDKKKKKGQFKLAFTNRKATKELANSASNELSKDDLSFMTKEEKLQLASWGLPETILRNYKAKGINSLFPWQLECLANEKVLEGRNLLYSAPTSAGKTLVSEILMIKRVLELGRKAIMILPFVSVAREKVYSLQSIFGDAGIRVEGFMGSVNPPGGFKAVDIAICTIEKANSLINKLLEEGLLADLGTVVVDELHLIGDPHRGYLLELLLTKLLYMTSIKNFNAENSLNVSEGASWRPKRFHIQIIGMSATLPNLDVLAQWLNAELYVTDFRPVPLKERLKIEDKLYDEKLEPVRDVKTEEIPIQLDGDIDNIVYLALETVLNGFSVLIFCPTKKLVESTAKRIADEFFRIGNPTTNQFGEIGEKLRSCLNGSRIKTVLDQLLQCPGGADKVLSDCIMFGIGYHHAGLTYENRDVVESAFKRGILKVIVATSTLSAGVNLPARRVMITTPLFNMSVLDTMTYRQMCGRAGRNGIDTEGESILICPATAKDKGMALFKGQMPFVKSALLGDGSLTSSMKRALLEAIASGIASLTSDVRSYARCTFLFHSIDAGLFQSEELTLSQVNKENTIEQCLEYLEKQDFIRIKHFEQEDKPEEYMPTQLGSACLASSLSPDDGIIVYKELVKARECFVLENELHVIYQVTPIYVSDQLKYIKWDEYLGIWENLDVSEKKVATLIGIKESFIIRAMIGTASWKNPSQRADMAIHQRFFAALALSDLVNEKSLDFVGNKYSLNKGVLQNLQQAASTFAGMVTAFCARLGWSNLELLLSQFQERLEFGVQRELCDLVRLECLNGQRARILYDAGLKTIVELAAADPAQVEHVLHKATPFNSTVHGGKESSIWMIGKESLTEAEAAKKIVDEARLFIQIELGHQGNILFAFGGNDAPNVTRTKQPTQDTLNASTMKNSVMLMDKANEGMQVQNAPADAAGTAMKIETSNPKANEPGGPQRPKDTNHEQVEDLNFDTIKDTEMEAFFSQRHEELERSKVVQNVESNHSDGEAIFEDSFPEMLPTEISALYNKPGNNAKEEDVDDVAGIKFSIEQEVEKVATAKPRTNVNVPEEKGRESRVQCDGYYPPMINNQQHSTPLTVGGSDTKRHRFTLRQEEAASPVRTLSPPAKAHESFRVVDGNDEEDADGVDCLDGELSHGILAELDKDFSSFGDVLECSMDFNGESINKLNDKSAAVDNVKKSESVRLSDSVAAAMKALADDTNFESEELFPEEEEDKECPPQEKAVPYNANPENGRFGGLEDEDFILTQGSFISDEGIEKEENEMFEGSSSETESSSAWTDNSAFNQIDTFAETTEIACFETMLGKVKFRTKVVTSADLIPSTFFSCCEMIGVGMKLVSQKKPSASIARQGIGAKVIGKGSTDANNLPQGESFHSMAVYNGDDTIWVLRWENENGLRVGGSRKNAAGNTRLEGLLGKIEAAGCAVAIFECKEKIKSLLRHCGSDMLAKLPHGGKIWDPRIAQWMWDFDDEDWNVSKRKLIDEYVTEEEKSISSSSFDKEVIEAFYVWKVMSALKKKLLSTGLWNHYITTEMPSITPLLLMEMNGLGLDSMQLGKLKRVLQFKSALLELRAFQLAGRQFNLASPKDIKQILFREIGLKKPKNKGTGKDVLLKLDHELPGVIVEWRKVTSALQKVVIPFQQERNLETGRVHGHYSHFTVTGRVVMSDPSLQCIPRDFDIPISYDAKEITDIKTSCRIKFGSKLTALFQQLDNNAVDMYILNNISLISMRNAFIPCGNEFVILTADYSQLELRILAHLSGDAKLLDALNKGTDVFVEIASQWKKLPSSQITNSIRQEAKGIVYGVIYGMSARTLSEQMEIDEREANYFITQFMRTYPGISAFIENTPKLCQEKGYVETMTGRRRYLPLIHSRNPQEKAKAFRQAVNSQIQGSASDLVKAAMTSIHAFLQSKYPKSALPIEWNKLWKARRSSLSIQPNTPQLENLIFFPILNLHDELIFEVRKTHLEEVAQAIKREMESCVKLEVKLPVVIKTGNSWGNLKVYGEAK